ncbi:MAG TPA: hypothetical protein PK514_09010 [Spirochaetota bacterium]|nr:hypothetical protein [Spirochaetota bacterium]
MNYKNIVIFITAISLSVSGCGKASSGKTYPRYGTGDNELISFSFTVQKNSTLGADAAGTISGETINVTVPHGTDVKTLVAVFVTDSTDVKVNDVPQISGETANDFSSDVIYTVTANDEVKTYTVKVAIAPSSVKTISKFYLNGTEGTIDQSTNIINVSLAPKTSLTSLTASFDAVCKKVLIGEAEQVSGETRNNFTGDVIYTVHAEDNSTRIYTVRATVQKAAWKEIGSFAFNTTINAAINSDLDTDIPGDFSGTTINFVLPYGSESSDLVATFTSTGEKVTVGGLEQKSGETHNNFSSSVDYVVEAEDGSSETYTVNVTIAKNSAKAITTFILDGETALIDEDAGTITTEFPQTKNITSLIADFVTTGVGVAINGADQVPGETANDFTANPVYRVTAEDGSYKDYIASVARSIEITGLWNFDSTASADYTVFEAAPVIVPTGTALQFDGFNDYVLIPDSDALTLAKAGSIEAMVKIISHRPFAGIVHKGVKKDFSDETFSLQYWTTLGKLRFLVTNADGDSSWIDSPTKLALDKWYYIVATWDVAAAKICIYINGSLDCEGAITTGDCRNSDGALVIGAQLPVDCGVSGWGNLGFNGLIDRVQLMSRALTAEEISARYAVLAEEESGLTAFILKAAPKNKPFMLTILLVIAALIGGLWAKNRLKHKNES